MIKQPINKIKILVHVLSSYTPWNAIAVCVDLNLIKRLSDVDRKLGTPWLELQTLALTGAASVLPSCTVMPDPHSLQTLCLKYTVGKDSRMVESFGALMVT